MHQCSHNIQAMWLVVTKVQSESFGLVTEHHHKIGVICASHIFAYWTPLTVTHVIFFIVECGIARFLCTMHVLEVRASSSPLGYLCAKFRFFCGLHCWASPCRKIMYSITQSLTQSPSLFDAPGTKAFTLEHLHLCNNLRACMPVDRMQATCSC